MVWRTVCAIWIVCSPTGVLAQTLSPEDSDQAMEAAYLAGMNAYHGLELERALSKLAEALELAQQPQVPRQRRARIRLSLGIVVATGVGDRQTAFGHFVGALCSDPDIEHEAELATPDVIELLQSARGEAERIGCIPDEQELEESKRPWIDPEVAPFLRKKKPPVKPIADALVVSPFFQVGMALGLAMLSDGMPADRPPQGLTTVDGGGCCIDLAEAGVVAHEAARFVLGLRVGPDLSVATLLRVQFHAGNGQLAGLLVGGRLEYELWRPGKLGPSVSLFGGATAGQIQVRAPRTDAYVLSGTGGVHLGTGLRYVADEHVALVFSPELDVQFPIALLNVDFTLALEVR